MDKGNVKELLRFRHAPHLPFNNFSYMNASLTTSVQQLPDTRRSTTEAESGQETTDEDDSADDSEDEEAEGRLPAGLVVHGVGKVGHVHQQQRHLQQFSYHHPLRVDAAPDEVVHAVQEAQLVPLRVVLPFWGHVVCRYL